VTGQTQHAWDARWQAERHQGLRDHVAAFFRKAVFAPTVNHFVNRYFPASGTFVEAGCGSGQASSGIQKGRRRLVALDISRAALGMARAVDVYDQYVQADLERLPFRRASIGGIWNLGVMEHFREPALLAILAEFDRVLVPGGRVLLFWPADYSSSQLVMRSLEFFIRLRSRDFRFYPDEYSRIHSPRQIRALIARSPLTLLALHHTWRNAYSDLVVVLEAAP
jgi:SAM-dependent methyltransferase